MNYNKNMKKVVWIFILLAIGSFLYFMYEYNNLNILKEKYNSNNEKYQEQLKISENNKKSIEELNTKVVVEEDKTLENNEEYQAWLKITDQVKNLIK